MRRKLFALIVALTAFSTLVPTAHAFSVIIAPSEGSQTDTFTVEGEGLQPGLALDINFKSPEGNVFSTAAIGQVVVVGPDGTFEFKFVPAREFDGSSLGTWLVQVCVAGTDDCIEGTFDIVD